MNFLELINKRYSVRSYTSDLVEDAKLAYVLEAGRLAPTAANFQPISIIVVHTAGREAELKQIYKSSWFAQVPLMLCVCGIPSKSWVRSDGKNYCDVDVAIVMDHLVLAATEQGLGTCWIGAFDAGAAKKALKLPEGVEPIVLTPLGYANDAPKPKKRKQLNEIVKYEYY